MARFIDLEDEEEEDVGISAAENLRRSFQQHHLSSTQAAAADDVTAANKTVDVVRTSNAATRIVQSIVSNIDLNTLDSLARTSFYIHDGLVQNRQVLISSALRCVNEHVPVDKDETLRFRARAGNWYYMEDGRGYNGKAGHCARDMVGGCRRCGKVICRNCSIKPPATIRERHRRLCSACTKAPISTLAKPPLDPELTLSSSELVRRSVCLCHTAEGVWLCQPCGRGIRAADHEYQRIWRWRSHYGEVLGGLGTGIGDGDRGVICGREGDCCAAKEREHEIDCDAEDARDSNASSWAEVLSPSPSTTSTNPPSPEGPTGGPLGSVIRQHDGRGGRTPSPQLRTGYQRHEIEGIGGVVKRKLVRMVRVGACVPEYDDENGPGRRALDSEVAGERRSWCGWCWRAIPGREDLEA
ncbi:Conserved hypothetical, protein [Geosmithia morbida]|uniref:Conserved hypothetical, protein n=1 Tax=Geosmithia morbida TaxID=1094350 RepID=A0A9P5D305_9HYPO|nr:Conserved hypothetical, protein [Geosmithia morbida]KAF4120019.1 Conserved hypothetical, protein [Geosmithia morbida]